MFLHSNICISCLYLCWFLELYQGDEFSGTNNDTTDNASGDEDTIQESQSPNSEGKYVPVCQKHNPKVKSPIPITGCVLGLANVHTWDDILKKFGVRKVESGAAKGKGKKKV
ncbi:hypothetical protein Tco_1536063 [Tanacetum coccineum]